LFNGVGGSEIIMVLLVVLLLFGSKRIPGFSRALGRGMGEFRRAMKEIREEIESDPFEDPPPPPTENPYADDPHSESPGEEEKPPAG
jgi:sec-independent protein translocase protein TatA